MVLHQTVDAKFLKQVKEWSQEEYPEDHPEIALNNWVIEHKLPGFFFLNDSGERFLWGGDLEYIHDYSRRGPGFYKKTVDTRYFYVRRYELSMKQIDTPKANGALIAHPSEKGWRLPHTHKRHFLNFPAEIQREILEEIISVPYPKSLKPSVISSNWGTCWRTPHFTPGPIRSIGRSKNDMSTHLVWIQRRDQYGPYVEIRDVFQALVDATVLRTNKYFYRTGIDILYGKNSFLFDTVDTTWHSSPPTLLPGNVLFRPPPSIPRREFWAEMLTETIPLIESAVSFDQLPGYIYYDHFIRFLHFIGPTNAARLKTLDFRGLVVRHPCRDKYCLKKGVDLIASVGFYILLINKFCTSVEKIVLCPEEDDLHCYGGPIAVDDIMPATHEEAILSFLENDLRTILTLKVLELVPYNDNNDISYAEPTIAWLKERHSRQVRERMDSAARKKLAKSVRSSNFHCGFCGEEHVWAECHNLCNFCGGFGHFRISCPALP